jgi:adenine-specific DNA-methyltransferase
MSGWGGSWDPTSRVAWAKAFGYAASNLFDPAHLKDVDEEYSILLDGRPASFALLSTKDTDLLLMTKPLEWAWSSHVRHVVAVHERSNSLVVRRWDAARASRTFPLPASREAASQVVRALEAAPSTAADNVVDHILDAFRSSREIVPDKEPVFAIELFNLLLLGTRLVKDGRLSAADLRSRRTVGEVLNRICECTDVRAFGIRAELFEEVANRGVYATIDRYLSPERRFNYTLDPSLVLRHASGDVYQEAHLELETTPQIRLAGFAPVRPAGHLRRAVRFTPPTLARSLTEQALSRRSESFSKLVILDPACGSGIFLIESVRELVRRGYKGHLLLRGIDKSEASAAMARFAVHFAIEEAKAAGIQAELRIEVADSMTVDWSGVDVILMNPPFVRWNDLDPVARQQMQEIISDVKGRPDLAMAFVMKAVKSLSAGGVVAAVVPAPILDSSHGLAWREELARTADVHLIGRFETYSYFAASLVEPAFLVMSKRKPGESAGEVKLVVAAKGAEDKSLRALRSPEIPPDEPEKWAVSFVSPDMLAASKWSPRWPHSLRLNDTLKGLGIARVQDLFDVRQGALTGLNSAFIIKGSEYLELPEAERRYFRPAAGSPTIAEGRLSPSEYVFFPYAGFSPLFSSTDDVKLALPTFFRTRLQAKRAELESRQGLPSERWWELTRPKIATATAPKLVSSYFGRAGAFAFDENGEYLVVQGYAWLWRTANTSEDFDGENLDIQISLTQDLALAYLAVLNSSCFEAVLDLFCPRVAGRQFNLSKRFVGSAYLPDLATSSTPPHVVDELINVGSSIHRGEPVDVKRIDAAAAAAYKVDASLFTASE